LLGAALAGSLVIAAAACALTASSFKYSSRQSGYVRLSHMAFTVNTSGDTWSQSHTTGLTTTTNGCFNADADLPRG
jgi:O-antigen ligase